MSTPINILLAEDNDDDVFLLRQAFKKAGVTGLVHGVCDGIQALAYLKGEGPYADREAYPFPDVLLLDLNMPRKNGFEVLQQVREDRRCSRLVVHVLTASSRHEDIQRSYDLRANSYLVKPSRIDDLTALAAALEQWHRFMALPDLKGE